MYLEELTNISGVSGNEKDVRDFIIKRIKDDVDELFVDNIGNLIALKKARNLKSTHSEITLNGNDYSRSENVLNGNNNSRSEITLNSNNNSKSENAQNINNTAKSENPQNINNTAKSENVTNSNNSPKGSNINSRTNSKNTKKVMLAAHMDEVGFMVSGITKEGALRIVQVGGIDERIISGKLVSVGKNKIPGVTFCGKSTKEISKIPNFTFKMEDLYIDIGASSRQFCQKYANVGDYVSFDSSFTRIGMDNVKAKALDDRAGCAVIMEMLKGSYDFDLYACFTVQEEVGLRGAEVAAFNVKPDIAYVIEGTTCSDLSNVEAHEYSTILGGGPAISIMDRTTYYDPQIRDFVTKVAQKNNIKLQIKNTYTGGNDSGKIQRSNKGVKVLVLSVPVRYIHSPSSVMSLVDYENMKYLLKSVLFETGGLINK